MDIGEKLGAEAAGLVKTEVLDAWTCLTGSCLLYTSDAADE